MNAGVVRTQVARIRMRTTQEFSPLLSQLNQRANPIAIPVICLQPNNQPVVAIQGTTLIQQKPQRAVVIRYHNIYGSIIINVSECRAAATFIGGKRRASDSRHLDRKSVV